MLKRCVVRWNAAVAALALAAGVLATSVAPAEARRHHGFRAHHARHAPVFRHHGRRHLARAPRATTVGGWGGYLAPTFASIVVDGNSGRTLAAQNENAPHHPASVTKVMTLYLLFEQIEKGRIALDDEIPISARAASQSPSKLGLRPGSTIGVEDAIKAIVTKSANDIAVAIAEKVGGDEETFAEMMTRKARSLGMYGTTYRNASGLPNPQQITTARDLAVLGRAIQDRFPKFYRYFSTHSFQYAGRTIPNHNHLLGRVEGVDGIKTGYTAASGFNLLTSVRRDGRHIVAVVLGGRTGAQRDRIMAGLIERNLEDGSPRRTAVAIAEREEEPRPASRVLESAPEGTVAVPRAPARVESPEPAAEPPRKPEPRREVAALELAAPVAPSRPRPAFVAATPRPEADAPDAPRPARRPVADGSTSRTLAYAPAQPTATPSSLRAVEPRARRPVAGRTEQPKAEPKAEAKPEPRPAERIALTRPAQSGWMIQIGATDDAGKANDLLARAKGKASLGGAKGFTEKVTRGGETLYRARFAGLEETSAAAACRSLKRSGFACFATKD